MFSCLACSPTFQNVIVFLTIFAVTAEPPVSTGSSRLASIWNACRYDDIASATIVSRVVFEGRVVDLIGASMAVFRVKTLLKGSLQFSRPRGSVVEQNPTRFRPVAVSLSSTASSDRKQYGVACGDSDDVNLTIGKLYIVFVDDVIGLIPQNSTSVGGVPRRPIDEYRMYRRPEISTESILEEVRRYSDPKSVKKPIARLTRVKQSIDLNEGDRLQLQCHASGQPEPLITWLKDGVAIGRDVRLSIRPTITRYTNRRGTGSLLRLNYVTSRDAGFYQCQASNVIDDVKSTGVPVFIRSDRSTVVPDKPHSDACDEHSYCLNGGTCYRLSSLSKMFCFCQNGFQGERCEEKSSVALQVLANKPEFGVETAPKNPNILPIVSFVLSSFSLLIVLGFVIFITAKVNEMRNAGRLAIHPSHDIRHSSTKERQVSINTYCVVPDMAQ